MNNICFKVIIFKTKLVKRVTLFYIFANLFRARLNSGQLDSHYCFCVQPTMTSCVMQPLYSTCAVYRRMQLEDRDLWEFLDTL